TAIDAGFRNELAIPGFKFYSTEMTYNLVNAIRIAYGNDDIANMLRQQSQVINAPVRIQKQAGCRDTSHVMLLRPARDCQKPFDLLQLAVSRPIPLLSSRLCQW